MINKILKFFKHLSYRYPLPTVVFIFISGIFFWGAFNFSMELTNTEKFCISCHEMKDNIYPEYKTSIHFANKSGVRASCPDCHVPKDWVHKFIRKVSAVNELYHKVIGTINTREKFLAQRATLAKHVWQTMKDTDSRECRNCHKLESMIISTQRTGAQKPHIKAKKDNRTCIDCHIGIAHKLPADLLDKKHDLYEQTKRPCADCHVGMGGYPIDNLNEDW